MQDITEFVKFIGGLGGVGMLGFFTYLWLFGKIATQRDLDKADARTTAMKAERDEWKGIAMRSVENNERLQQTTHRTMVGLNKMTDAMGDGHKTEHTL